MGLQGFNQIDIGLLGVAFPGRHHHGLDVEPTGIGGAKLLQPRPELRPVNVGGGSVDRLEGFGGGGVEFGGDDVGVGEGFAHVRIAQERGVGQHGDGFARRGFDAGDDVVQVQRQGGFAAPAEGNDIDVVPGGEWLQVWQDAIGGDENLAIAGFNFDFAELAIHAIKRTRRGRTDGIDPERSPVSPGRDGAVHRSKGWRVCGCTHK